MSEQPEWLVPALVPGCITSKSGLVAATTGEGFAKVPNVVERYYEQFYSEGNSETGDNLDQYAHCHSNGLACLGLAFRHVILQQNKTIVKVNFDIGKKDKSTIAVSGKKKRGALWLEPHMKVCELECSDGTVYPFRAGVAAKLIEVNEELVG